MDVRKILDNITKYIGDYIASHADRNELLNSYNTITKIDSAIKNIDSTLETIDDNELSDRLGITMGTASVAVNKLTEKYFIERNRSDEDRRKVYVQLSKKGLLAYKYHVSFHSNILEKVTTDIKKEKLDTFVEVFQTIVHNLNKIKKDIQPESILNFEKGDIVQVSSIKGSPAIRKYLNEKGISIKSLISVNISI